MAEAVAEPVTQVVDPASTAVVSTPSSAAQEPASIEEQASGGEEGESASQEQEEPVARTGAELHTLIAGTDLLDAVADGTLTKDEAKTLTSYRQSLADKSQKLQARLSVTSKALADANGTFWTTYSDPSTGDLPEALRAEILGPKWQARDVAVGNHALAEADVHVTAALAELRGGDALAKRAELSDLPFIQKVTALVPEIWDLAQADSKKEIADLKRELRESKKARANEAAEKVPATGKVTGNFVDGSDLTYAQYTALSEADKKKFNQDRPDKFREFLGIK